jgi:hypothetical protein
VVELLIDQPVRLEQDRVGDADLADVVNRRGEPDSIVWVREVREAYPEQLVGGVAGHRAHGAVDTRKAGARPVT